MANLSRQTLAKLQEYAWPGNVRELQNVLMRYAVTCELIIPGNDRAALAPLAPDVNSYNLETCLENAERECLKRALATVNGRKDKAARLAGLSLRTFHRRCAKYEL